MRRHHEVQRFVSDLKKFSNNECSLLGLTSNAHYETFAMQLIDSIRRIQYVEAINNKNNYSLLRMEPNSIHFDPLIAAKLHNEKGNYDEACWLIFLSTHFGKISKQNGNYAEIYTVG